MWTVSTAHTEVCVCVCECECVCVCVCVCVCLPLGPFQIIHRLSLNHILLVKQEKSSLSHDMCFMFLPLPFLFDSPFIPQPLSLSFYFPPSIPPFLSSFTLTLICI